MTTLLDTVRAAGARREVRAAVAQIYAELQVQIDRRRPLCVVSGRCCRFDQYGHRLYVTTMELACFVAQFEESKPSAPKSSGMPFPLTALTSPGGCPFQEQNLCTVHSIRPFGCRIFFCDDSSTEWQHEQYEQFHHQLRLLHDRLGVPYAYLEWRNALKMLNQRS